MAAVPELYSLPISARPRRTWTQTIRGAVFMLFMIVGCLMIHSSHLVAFVHLKLLPFAWAQRLYTDWIRYSKGAFTRLLVFMCQCFAPTTLVVSFEKDGPGKVTQEELEAIVERDRTGQVVALHLPQKAVVISNHQTYADWWYVWCLMYYTGTGKDVYIVLKKSLKWLPVLGWGMQFFNFIFLARSWAADRLLLVSSLAWLGRRAQQDDTPMTFVLYPEGTVVSNDTRPRSKSYAEKLGIPDMVHTILPRSTGLHYSLRTLYPRMPSLKIIDVTMWYPGVPPYGNGQLYYTLRSIFLDGVSPPTLHMHIRLFDVSSEVPIGDVSATNPKVLPNGSGNSPMEVEIPEAEREKFDVWLREIWRGKDVLIQKYLDSGSFVDGSQKRFEIPLRLQHKREALDAFYFVVPGTVAWGWTKLFRKL
ncbi:acyltransferase-domain-containing protein [Amylocystis lapponica]|nr:acyltransferase-domain-containing protein [Amylocystis lapponica]